jgi:hypothetical protein
MGSLRNSKAGRAKGARSGERPPTRKILRGASIQAQAKVAEIPARVLREIDNQRGVLVTVITLLHCLHVVLEQREEGPINEALNLRIDAAVRWASLPEMTTMLLERTHAVLSALDSNNLTNALTAGKP